MGYDWGKETRGNYYAVLDAKGGCGLSALHISSKQWRKLEGCRSKVCSSGKMDEARFLRKMLSVISVTQM